MRRTFFAAGLVILVLNGCGMGESEGAGDGAGMGGMESPGMGAMEGMDEMKSLPPVKGFFDGHVVLFVHPEASDAKVAGMLTGMMNSPVIVVPALADVPDTSLADVFVFTNGVRPAGARGPLGFQPDVFDSAPGAGDYSPLRRLNSVTWTDDADARLLRRVAEINEARASGELTIERTHVVVNMPFLTWPGGNR